MFQTRENNALFSSDKSNVYPDPPQRPVWAAISTAGKEITLRGRCSGALDMNHGPNVVYPKVTFVAGGQSGLAAINRQCNWLYIAFPKLIEPAICPDPNISFAI